MLPRNYAAVNTNRNLESGMNRNLANLNQFLSCISRSFKRFADHTTFHGFYELHYAKSLFWKIIWFFATIITIGLAVYQCYSGTLRYINKPTITLIEPLSEDIEYPPLTICYQHWLLWVNWKIGIELGFEKDSMFYGMSFISEVISETVFDVSNAKEKFVKNMKKNGFETILDFYSAVSHKSPPGITVYGANEIQWEKFLDPDMVPYTRFCYRLSTDVVKKALQMIEEFEGINNIITFAFRHNFMDVASLGVSLTEYQVYLERFTAAGIQVFFHEEELAGANENYVDENVTDIKFSPYINVDNVRTNHLMLSEESFEARLRLSGSLYRWLNDNKRKPCARTKSLHYENCHKFCYWKEIQDFHPEKCIEVAGAQLIGEHNLDKICTYNTTFIPDMNVTIGTYFPSSYPSLNANKLRNRCVTDHCTVPCELWKFSTTFSDTDYPSFMKDADVPTLLVVEYPADVLAYTEVRAVSFESVFAEIGGIIGLWLGASILSILQMFYLCCCSKSCVKFSRVRKSKAQVKNITLPRIPVQDSAGGPTNLWGRRPFQEHDHFPELFPAYLGKHPLVPDQRLLQNTPAAFRPWTCSTHY